MRSRQGLASVALTALLSGGAHAASSGLAQEGARVERVAELALTLTFPPLEGFAPGGTNRWRGQLGPSQVEIAIRTLARGKFELAEPEDVLDYGPSAWRAPEQERNEPGTRRAVSGPFGYASYAVWERSELRSRDGKTHLGLRFLLGGLLEEKGYWITLEASPPPTAEGEAQLVAFLTKGVAYDGAVREHRWSDEEARARWQRDAPAATHAELETLRTAHYLVLTNSSGGKSFAKKMEECHEAIRKVYPFDDIPTRRLMPVFLFRTPDQYFEFYSRIAGIEIEEAKRSKGHAWRDYYATWYDAPGDPVHIHEATHQIFANRLGLGGGGSWFQEGVAEYMSSRPSDRAPSAGQVKKRKHVPLAEFVTIPSLLMSSDKNAPGGDQASNHYDTAALLIEFLRESKWAKDQFPAFLTRVGRVPRGDRNAIEAEIQAVYGVGLAGLEDQWVEYCKKR